MSLSTIWPRGCAVKNNGELTFHGIGATELLERFGSPLYVMDTDEVAARARYFVASAAEAFRNATTRVSFAGKAFLSKEIVRIALEAGMHVDTCTMGEMRIALAAGAPGRRLVLHGNNKSDAELEFAIREGFDKIVVDSPDEPARIEAIAKRLGKRVRVMLRVTSGIHAGGHEYISTAHEDQKFGVPLLPAGADASVLDVLNHLDTGDCGSHPQSAAPTAPAQGGGQEPQSWPPLGRGLSPEVTGGGNHVETQPAPLRSPYDIGQSKPDAVELALAPAMEAIANGPAIAVLKDILSRSDTLELVGVHSHIGSNIHDADAFIQAARRMMLLRKTFYATDAITMPEVDLGGGYSVAYTDGEDAMDVKAELTRLAEAVTAANRALGMPMPAISFEPGRFIVAPAGVSLYTVGTVKPVHLTDAKDKAGNPIETRTYVSVDGGMSDNIRPALYGADYTARLANRRGADDTMLARVVGMHCESGDILVHEVPLPADTQRGDALAIPVTGAYGRTMASNYNQAFIPAVVAVSAAVEPHVMIRRQTIGDLLALDVSE